MRKLFNTLVLLVAAVGILFMVNEGAKRALAEQAIQAQIIASCFNAPL